MNTHRFDAALDLKDEKVEKTFPAVLSVGGNELKVSVEIYPLAGGNEARRTFALIESCRSLDLKWKDKIALSLSGGKGASLQGIVLHPFPKKMKEGKREKHMEILEMLLGTEEEMIAAFTIEKGLHGLAERELLDLSHISEQDILQASRAMEVKGEVRIVSFSPLLLVPPHSVSFLCERIEEVVRRFHGDHADEIGIPREKLEKRLSAHPRVFRTAISSMMRSGKLRKSEDTYSLQEFHVSLNEKEERILKEMEEMYLKGELRSVSLGEIKDRYHLSQRKIDILISLLIERKKIVQSREGFILHSAWLEDIIQKIRSLGKNRLSVPEFKEMTGLTRKFAIPVLELLDEMGVTRRDGADHEILRNKPE